jgi:hypothetical protein
MAGLTQVPDSSTMKTGAGTGRQEGGGMSWIGRIGLSAAIAFSVPATALSAPPDPATVNAPAITEGRDHKVAENGWKWFYFHRPATTYTEAYADLEDCYRFLPVPFASGVEMPGFTPWRARADSKTIRPVTSNYGLVGGIIGSMVAGPIERRASQSRMRRCMEPKGYQRYPMTEETWKAAVHSYSPLTLAVQAKLASGPVPDAAPVPEDK